MIPQQITGPIGPAQVTGVSGYYPAQTDMMTSMMPMIMMIMMLAMIMPMMKGITK